MSRRNNKRILVIRIDFLGDMVCTTALLHAIKLRWPQAEIHVLANKYNAPVLENNTDVTKVYQYVYSKKYTKNLRPGIINAFIDRLKLIYTLRKQKFETLIIPNGGMNKNAIQFAKLLNVHDCRWHNKGSEFDDRILSHIENRTIEHEVLAGFALMPELGQQDISQMRLHVAPCAQRAAHWREQFGEKTKPRIGLFVSNKSVERRWAWNKWAALAAKTTPLCDVFVFCTPQEHFPLGWGEEANMHRIRTGTVSDLVAAMAHLDLVISADSAPVHLAAALQIPVVALFESRPEKYLRWYPLGVEHVLIHEGRHVDDISVDSVFSATIKLLGQREENQ